MSEGFCSCGVWPILSDIGICGTLSDLPAVSDIFSHLFSLLIIFRLWRDSEHARVDAYSQTLDPAAKLTTQQSKQLRVNAMNASALYNSHLSSDLRKQCSIRTFQNDISKGTKYSLLLYAGKSFLL